MSAIAEQVFEAVKALSEPQAAEVLDFVEFLRAKAIQRHGGGEAGAAAGGVSAEEHAGFIEEMRAIRATQPMTHATVEDMRREARY
ncbi:hypothetical protein [Methylomagnum sp.]